MRFPRAAALSFTLLLACNGSNDPSSSSSSGAAGAAAGSSASSGFDAAKFETAAAAKMNAVLKLPSVETAMNGAWDKIGSDPKVAAAGEGLMSGLASNPAFTPVAAEFMAKLQNSPAFLELVTDYMNANAGAGMAGFEAAFGAHVQAQIDRPEVQQALDAAVGRLIEKPEIQQSLNQLVKVITVDSGISQEIGRNVASKLNSPEVLRELESKAGTKPGDADYDAKLFAYLTDEARLERFMVGFAELFAEHPAPRVAVVAMLQSPAVITTTAEQVAAMLRAPKFYELAEAALVAALDGSDRATVEAKLDALLAQPEVVAAFSAWVSQISEVPEVKQGFAEAFKQLFADEAFAKLMMTAFLG